MGLSHSVHMANATDQDIHVMVSLNPSWAIVDVITDVALLFVAVGEIKQVATAAELPQTIANIHDLYEFLQISAKFLSGTVSAGSRPGEAALALVEAFKKNSIHISPGQYKQINERGLLELYLNASGIAGLLGASTISVMVMSDDGKQIAMFNSNSNYSWIATSEQKLVRSKYRSIWQEKPGAGTVDWPIASNSVPIGSVRGVGSSSFSSHSRPRGLAFLRFCCGCAA